MENQFISKQNVRNLYAFINSVVQKNENVNLDSDKKYKKMVKKLKPLRFGTVHGEQAIVDKFCNNDICEIIPVTGDNDDQEYAN